jgi:hypothetical protein
LGVGDGGQEDAPEKMNALHIWHARAGSLTIELGIKSLERESVETGGRVPHSGERTETSVAIRGKKIKYAAIRGRLSGNTRQEN